MSCNTKLIDKKSFGINVYKTLNKLYGQRDHYEVIEIKEVIKQLDYPQTWECWALVAFMLPANVGEYFRAKGQPMDIIAMKKELIEEMTDGKRSSLAVPQGFLGSGDLEKGELSRLLTHRSLTNYFAAQAGFGIGFTLGANME